MLNQKGTETKKVRVLRFFSNDIASTEYLQKALDDKRFYFAHSGKLAKYILLRTDMETWELENFSGYPGTVTVEHILPQTPESNGPWDKLFTKEERDEWTNKVGNYVLLSGRKTRGLRISIFKGKKTFTSKKKAPTSKLLVNYKIFLNGI